MNLYLRVFFMFLRSMFRGKTSVNEDFFTNHIVWPNDVDVLGHMNNGRYFTVTDLIRIEWLVRAGVWRALRKRGFHAVIAGETAQFRRALKPFQRYRIQSRNLGWDDKFFYVEHRFMVKGEVHAISIVKVRVVGQDPRPQPAEVMRWAGEVVEDERLDPVITSWNLSTRDQWQAATHSEPGF